METRERVEIKKELGGNVKVSVFVGGQWVVYVWNMSETEAREEAEEIIRRKAA